MIRFLRYAESWKNSVQTRLLVLLAVLCICVFLLVVQLLTGWTEQGEGQMWSSVRFPFVPSNLAQGIEELKWSGSAVLLVHIGYLDGLELVETDIQSLREDSSTFGDYDRYLENVQLLRLTIEEEALPEIQALEKDKYVNIENLPVEHRPSGSTLILVTMSSSGIPIDGFIEDETTYYQKQEYLFDFLSENNIRRIYCAGELGWYDNTESLGDGFGCLSIVAARFREAGFETIGIIDCMYPANPPPDEQMQKDGATISSYLYEHSITLGDFERLNRSVNGELSDRLPD